MNLFKRLFSKSPKKTVDPEAAAFLKSLLENELTTTEMQQAAKSEAGPSVILTPAVPLPTKNTIGWFGGAPALPSELDWPEIEGTPLCFVAQINLAELPQNIWSGVGPRQGNFAFFIHPTETRAKVLHIDGLLETKQGQSPMLSYWFRNHHDKRPPVNTHFPQWPVHLTGHVGELPEPAGWHKGNAPGFSEPFKNEEFDLANPAHQPFDETTLDALIELIDEVLERRLNSTAMFLETKKLRDDVACALNALQAKVQTAHDRFLEIKEGVAPFRETFDRVGVLRYLQALNELTFGDTNYRRNDEEGYAEIEVSTGKLIQYASRFLRILERHAKYAYLDDPEKLSEEAKARFEIIWAFDAIHERGGMSHPPKGHIYTPHGPSSPNEVLLELPTSDLLGWIWGDMYSVIFTIARDDLAKGKLDNIIVDITN
ncbi:hypothetical protein LP7551_01465 [Roseibium album]|nr:hypothetical protein LP7551_01465 [Roseibium album]